MTTESRIKELEFKLAQAEALNKFLLHYMEFEDYAKEFEEEEDANERLVNAHCVIGDYRKMQEAVNTLPLGMFEDGIGTGENDHSLYYYKQEGVLLSDMWKWASKVGEEMEEELSEEQVGTTIAKAAIRQYKDDPHALLNTLKSLIG